jgi:hypothetical protein
MTIKKSSKPVKEEKTKMVYRKSKYKRQIRTGKRGSKAKSKNKASLHKHIKNSRALSKREKAKIHKIVKRA